MKSQVSEFKLIDRGFKSFLVLIPGWATDFRIFNTLNLDYNYLVPVKFEPSNFNAGLTKILNKESIKRISLFGWSLGGFLAQEFALNNHKLIEELLLVSIRRRYEPGALEKIKSRLFKNKKAFLYKFYLECFSDNDLEALAWFKNSLLEDYCRGMELNYLLSGLDYLSRVELKIDSLGRIKKLRIFHGRKDAIAPFKEAILLRDDLPLADFVSMPECGHIPFLAKDFRDKFNGYCVT